MPTSRTNKILTAIVVIALIAAIGVLVFAYIPWGGFPNQNENKGPSITVSMDAVNRSYTKSDLQGIGNFTGVGGYRTQFPMIKGNGTYTGVYIESLIHDFSPSLTSYSLNITAMDNVSYLYNLTVIQGGVDLYDASNATNTTPIGHGGVKMMLAWEYNNQPLNNSRDSFRIAFINNPSQPVPITDASLWLKDIRSIQVIPR